MSIGIAVVVPDGIALAADTQTTWSETITRVKEKDTNKPVALADPLVIPIGWSRMTRKLFAIDLGGKTFAVATSGAALINSKSTFAVFQSAAHKYPGEARAADRPRAARYPESIRDQRMRTSQRKPTCMEAAEYLIHHVKSELASHFTCSISDLPQKPLLSVEFLIAGYDDDDVANPVLQRCTVWSGRAIDGEGKVDFSGQRLVRTNTPPNTYTASWTGQAAYIGLVVNHQHKGLPMISSQFPYMTLADAVDYANFLVSFTCDFQRFASMVPNCARPITSAKLTPEGYEEELIP